jgi:hypothetical protein
MREASLDKISTKKRYWALGLFILIVAFRIYLVSDRDILATYSPYDEYWQVDAALRGIAGGGYTHMVFAHLPMYATWLMLLGDIGFPARQAIDLMWLAGSGYLAYAIRGYTGKAWAGMLAFLLVAYHPYSLVLFDRALAETLLAALSLVVVAAGLELWNLRGQCTQPLRRKLATVLYCTSFAVAFHTRKEGVVLLVPIGLMAVFAWRGRAAWWPRGGGVRPGMTLVVYPLLATLALGGWLAGVNYLRWGVFARYELAAPQYVRATKALIAIDSGVATPKHVTVTAAARALAYRASPTFAQLRSYFDGAIGKNLERMTSEMEPGVAGEIGDWVFYWAIRDAAASSGWHQHARDAEAKYEAVANEIERAFENGGLKKRAPVLSFIDPDWGKWLPALPVSVWKELELVLEPSVSTANVDRPLENASSQQYRDYALLLGRRHVRQQYEMIGWATAPAGSLIGFGAAQPGKSWALLDGPVRTDVAGAIPFTIRADETDLPSKVFLRLSDGRAGTVELQSLGAGQIHLVQGLDGIQLGIEYLYQPSKRSEMPRLERLSNHIDEKGTDSVVLALARAWSVIGMLMLAGVVVALLVGLVRKTATEDLMVIVVLASLVVARSGLFGILDASSWYSQASRYMFPAVPFFITAAVVGMCTLHKVLRGQRSKADM